LETLMALRDLAGDRARVALVAAEPAAAAPGPAPAGFVDLEVPLETIDGQVER
jgi:hypothetical protein